MKGEKYGMVLSRLDIEKKLKKRGKRFVKRK